MIESECIASVLSVVNYLFRTLCALSTCNKNSHVHTFLDINVYVCIHIHTQTCIHTYICMHVHKNLLPELLCLQLIETLSSISFQLIAGRLIRKPCVLERM